MSHSMQSFQAVSKLNMSVSIPNVWYLHTDNSAALPLEKCYIFKDHETEKLRNFYTGRH